MTTSIIRAGGTGVPGVQTTGGDDGALALKVGPLAATVEALSITTAGSVGIGTASPSAVFHVSGASVPAKITSTNNALVMRFELSSTSSTAFIGTNNNSLVMAPSTGAIGATLTSTGLGIGTASPANKLEVVGAIVAQGAVSAYTNTGLYLQNKGASVFDVGAFRSGASVAELTFSTDSGSDTAPVERVRITGAGNVGIGRAVPATKLHLDGDVNTILRIDSQNTAFTAGTVIGEIQLHGKYHSGSALDTRYAASIIKNVKDSADGTGGSAMTFSTSLTGGGGVSEKLRITKAGNVGIGTAAPTHLLGLSDLGAGISESIGLEFGTANADGAQFTFRTQTVSTGGMRQTRQAAGDFNLGFYNWDGGTQALRMVINDTGKVGIGTASPETYGTLAVRLSTSANVPVLGMSVSSVSPLLNHYITDSGGTVRTLNQIQFGTGSTNSANYQGFMSFSTASSAAVPTERMRIDAIGNVLVGTTANIAANAKIFALGNGVGIAVGYGTGNAEYRHMYINFPDGNLNFFSTSNNATLSAAGAFTNASDERIKKNIVDIKYGLEDVLKIQPRSYQMKEVAGDYIGLIAQEMEEIIPEVVSGGGEEQYTLDYGSLVAVAFKAIQEQQATIEALTTRITALEG